MFTHYHFILYKPDGYLSQFVTNQTKRRNKKLLGELYDFPDGTMAIGRLDEPSEGLLLLTTDGKLSEHIRSNKVEKEYYAQVDGLINKEAIEKLRLGVEINTDSGKYMTLPCTVKALPKVPSPSDCSERGRIDFFQEKVDEIDHPVPVGHPSFAGGELPSNRTLDQRSSSPPEKGEYRVAGRGYCFPFSHLMGNHSSLPPRSKKIRDDRHGPTSWISITLTEGKFRQVRKMTAVVGFPTLRLVRVRIGNIHIDNLNPQDVLQVERFEA